MRGRPRGGTNFDWSKADWSLPDTQIARAVGCSQPTVFHRRIALGREPRRKRIDWSSVDWRYTNRCLAQQLGITAWTIGLKRHQLGKPRGNLGRSPSPKGFDHSKIDWSRKDAWNARKLGVTKERIRQLRIQAGLPSSSEIPAPHPEWWSRINPRKTARQNAKKLGVCIATIYNKAKELGITLKSERRLIDWKSVDWRQGTNDIAAQLKTHPVLVSKMRRKLAPKTLRRR